MGPGIKLTTAGLCSNPRCAAPIYAKLLDPALDGFLICADCEERHGERKGKCEVGGGAG